LKESKEELKSLVEHLVSRMTGAASQELVMLVLEVLDSSIGGQYAWPGNVRELETSRPSDSSHRTV
jgi:transcriptional regulator with PAS, ATPase and Fis domain